MQDENDEEGESDEASLGEGMRWVRAGRHMEQREVDVREGDVPAHPRTAAGCARES